MVSFYHNTFTFTVLPSIDLSDVYAYMYHARPNHQIGAYEYNLPSVFFRET